MDQWRLGGQLQLVDIDLFDCWSSSPIKGHWKATGQISGNCKVSQQQKKQTKPNNNPKKRGTSPPLENNHKSNNRSVVFWWARATCRYRLRHVCIFSFFFIFASCLWGGTCSLPISVASLLSLFLFSVFVSMFLTAAPAYPSKATGRQPGKSRKPPDFMSTKNADETQQPNNNKKQGT